MTNALRQFEDIKAILASVYYLCTEAEKAGLKPVNKLFIRLIADLEACLASSGFDSRDLLDDVVESDLYSILQILDRFSHVNQHEAKRIVAAVESLYK